ncbi:hypothetical protein C8E01_1063 [Pontibacter virosus]|uniref:Uncharacterized protein n=1 Tax=Pontibacter virosus TaxID=1765052 RepID=A0A2U1AW59_9BACT|nr:hypothetical protein C8E01_1063 [Pontibacter virosus]
MHSHLVSAKSKGRTNKCTALAADSELENQMLDIESSLLMYLSLTELNKMNGKVL